MSDVYDIAASGMAAQRAQMDLIAENLANADAVRTDRSVYRAKTAVLESSASFEPALRDALLRSDLGGSSFSETDDLRIDATGSEPAEAASSGGVAIARIVENDAPPQFRYDPGNPFAAKSGPHKGYVSVPAVNAIEQMVALVASGRAYDADVSMLQAAKQMDLEAADIDRV